MSFVLGGCVPALAGAPPPAARGVQVVPPLPARLRASVSPLLQEGGSSRSPALGDGDTWVATDGGVRGGVRGWVPAGGGPWMSPPSPFPSQISLAAARGLLWGRRFPCAPRSPLGCSGAEPGIGANLLGWGGCGGGSEFPQELGRALAPWGGGKQPPAPLLPLPMKLGALPGEPELCRAATGTPLP